MPTLPLTPEQKDAIRQYLHANYEALPKRDILILNAFEIFSNCELADILEGPYHDRYDPTGNEYPRRRQFTIYDRIILLERYDLTLRVEDRICAEHCCRSIPPAALIFIYDVADRESFIGLEKAYETTCEMAGLEKNYDKVYTRPARAVFQRVIDIFCKPPKWEALIPFPILVVGVIASRTAPRQVTYDEGLAISDRLSAIFYETTFSGFSFDCLEELVTRCILAKTKL